MRGTTLNQEIDMTHEDTNEGRSVLYWITLGTIFAALIAVALS
jgi:hypothetical protein